MPSIEDTLPDVNRHYKLFPQNETIVVAVSGGADSLCLLHTLHHHLAIPLHVATFDHQWRPDSHEDAHYVAELADSWGLPATIGRAETNTTTPHTEAHARHQRYRFLAQTAQAIGATTVATAHHAHDQTETILHRIVRGTSLRGLRAMQPVAPFPQKPDLRLVRPLLTITRQQILDYCHRHQLQPRHDPSNDDTRYLRNALRHNILPQLQQINPAFNHALNRLARQAYLEDDFIQNYMRDNILPHIHPHADGMSIDLAPFLTWHPALQQRALVWIYEQTAPDDAPELTANQIENARHVMTTGQVGDCVHLVADKQVRRDYQAIFIEPRHTIPSDERRVRLAPDEYHPLTNERWHTFPTWHLRITSTSPPVDDRTLTYNFYAPPDAPFALRTRQPGDRFRPVHLRGHQQKLKAWLINQKIPAYWRDTIPLLMHNDTILALLFDTHAVFNWRYTLTHDDWLPHTLQIHIPDE